MSLIINIKEAIQNNGHLLNDQINLIKNLWVPLQAIPSNTTVEFTAVKIISEGAGYFVFEARGTLFMGKKNQAVEGMLFEYKGSPQLVLKAKLPLAWNFAHAFGDLPEYVNFSYESPRREPSLFSQLKFERSDAVTAIYSSSEIDDDIYTAFKLLLDPFIPGDHLKKIRQGINCWGKISNNNKLVFNPMLALLGIEGSLPFFCYVALDADPEQIWLEININKDIQAGPFHYKFRYLVLYTSTSLYVPGAELGIYAEGDLKIDDENSIAIELDWPIGSKELIISNVDPIPLFETRTFEKLGGSELTKSFSTLPFPKTNSLLEFLEIRALQLRTALAANSMVPSAELDLSIGPNEDWEYEVIKGIFAVEDVLLKTKIASNKPFQLQLHSNFNIAGGIVHVSASYPEYIFQGSLGLHQSIDLKALIAHFIPKAPLPDHLQIMELELEADLTNKLYRFEIDIASDWELAVDQLKIMPLEQVRLVLDNTEEGTFATIEAIMNMGGVHIDLLATNIGEEANGWTFTGKSGEDEEIPFGLLIKYLAERFSNGSLSDKFPKALASLTLSDITVSFNTSSKNFSFFSRAYFRIYDTDVDITTAIRLHKIAGNTYQKTIDGHITLGREQPLDFHLLFDSKQKAGDNATDLLIASYEDAAGVGTFDIGKFINTFSDSLNVPEGFTVTLNNAQWILLRTPKSDAIDEDDEPVYDSKMYLGVDLGNGINLSKLPLIGKVFPANETIKLNYSLHYQSGDFDEKEVDEIAAILPDVELNSNGADDGQSQQHFQLKITLQIGNHSFTFDPNLTPAPQDNNTSGNTGNTNSTDSENKPARLPVAKAPATNNTPASDTGVHWYDIQRAFGPVHFNRIGMTWDSGKDKSSIKFLIDANLTVGGLNLSLDGLYVESPLTEFDPHFGLNGLSVDYKSNALEITGGLLRNGENEYSGQALIRFGKFSISALGNYTNHDNHPSLIIYAALNEPIGGPAWFFVNGISAALGYNRALILPGLTEVVHFPLVQEASDSEPDAEFSDAGKRLRSLGRYIPASTGEHFIAAGINFSSFRIIQSSVLLAIKAGKRFEIDLLGVSTLSLKSKQGAMLAWVQMGVVGSFIPDEGSVIVQAQLMDGSYILSQNCHLTGGFAFAAWFKGPYNGDFVITLGGYHPHFKKPQHYPTVPRLAFNWNVDKANTTHIKGDAYFALCPHVIMAGGHLSVTYQHENISAWFNVGADMLLGWKPFHYELEAYINIGGAYTFQCFGTHHITVDVGAKLAIWGPEFGGSAALDLWVCTLEIAFGEKPKTKEPISWSEFKKAFLPEDHKCIVATPKRGMVNKKKTAPAHLGAFNPKEMVIGIDVSIPVKEIRSKELSENENKQSAKANKNIGVAPAGVDPSKLTSTIDVTVEYGSIVPVNFEYEAVLKKIPAGLWGTTLKSDINDKGLLDDVIMGLEIKPAKHIQDKTGRSVVKGDARLVNSGVIVWGEDQKIPSTPNLTRRQLMNMLDLDLITEM